MLQIFFTWTGIPGSTFRRPFLHMDTAWAAGTGTPCSLHTSSQTYQNQSARSKALRVKARSRDQFSLLAPALMRFYTQVCGEGIPPRKSPKLTRDALGAKSSLSG